MTEELNLDPKQLHFIPLGGSEQFGVNFNTYAYDGKWLAIDCGIGFAGAYFPGIDIFLPDPSFLEERRDDLVGLIVTHAHEDHIGAVPHLWPRLRCPIYCTAFTAAVMRRKFEEAPDCKKAEINIVKAGDVIDLAPFKAQFVHMAHSIPDNCSLILETPAGRVVHSGDWNLDPTPVIGAPTDFKTLQEAGKKGVMAYIGDSTNSEVIGRAGSEKDVEKGLESVFRACKGRIAVTLFASNIGRMRSIAKAAESCGRSVAVVGRSLHTMSRAGRECGFLEDVASFLSEEEINTLPNEQQIIMLTGSQGEARAALAKVARGDHPSITLNKGDTVVFSSRAIPGNEVEINYVKNNLSAGGVNIITPRDTEHCIHVSGHPCKDEVADMYQWTKPKLVVPVHGERTHLEAQAVIARACQIEHVLVPSNGSVIRLGPDTPEIIDHVETGLLAVDPKRILSSHHKSIAERRKLQFTGVIHITLALDDRGDLLSDPQISIIGLLDPDNPGEERIEKNCLNEIEDILADIERGDLSNDHMIQEEIRIGVRRFMYALLGIKPKTTVHVMRV